MPTREEYRAIDRLFEPPNPKPGTLLYAVVQARKKSEQPQAELTPAASPADSATTLVNEECEIDIFNAFKPVKHETPASVPDIQADLRKCSVMTARSKDLLLDFQHKQKAETPSDINELISIANFPLFRRASSTRPTPPLTTPTLFNPRAAPFMPARPYVPEKPKRNWFDAFWAGTMASDPLEHKLQAVDLVNGRQWSFDSLAELAQHFCWKGAEGDFSRSPHVAAFCRVVYTTIAEKEGEWYASCFHFHLRECVLGTFRACWKSEQPQAISIKNRPSPAYLTSAICLAAFIGDLFVQNFLTTTVVHSCLTILLGEVTAVEHIHAIHALLLHANKRMWKIRNAHFVIIDFVASFTEMTDSLGDNTSVVGTRIRKTQIRAWVKEIVEMVNRWRPPPLFPEESGFVLGETVLSIGLEMQRR